MKAVSAGAVALVLLAVLLGGPRLNLSSSHDSAQAASQHPVVGSWSSAHFLFTFAADGTATGTDKDGQPYQGAWQPAGANTATFVLQTLLPEGGGQGLMGPLMVDEASDELVTSGQRFTRLVPPPAANYDLATPAES